MVMISEGENMKKLDFLPLKGNNSYKGSFDNFEPIYAILPLCSIFSNGGHVFYRNALIWTNLKDNLS